MKDLIKRYWDILGGIFSALGICVAVEFEIIYIQLAYSIIILLLVCIGLLRFIKESVEKRRNKRDHNIIDSVIDSQKSIKAIEIINNPGKPGEELGETFILTYREVHRGMEKFKELWSKYKGYLLTLLTTLLAFIEGHYGFINELVGGYLVIGEVEVLPIAFIVISLVVALLSNNFDADEWKVALETIKALRQNKKDNKALNDEVKRIIKENETTLKSVYKTLTTAEKVVVEDEKALADAQKSLDVKTQLYVSKVIPVEEYDKARKTLESANAQLHKDMVEVERLNKEVGKLETKIEELKSKKV